MTREQLLTIFKQMARNGQNIETAAIKLGLEPADAIAMTASDPTLYGYALDCVIAWHNGKIAECAHTLLTSGTTIGTYCDPRSVAAAAQCHKTVRDHVAKIRANLKTPPVRDVLDAKRALRAELQKQKQTEVH